MAEETTDTNATETSAKGKRGYTPPKNRPTRARDGIEPDRRVFGPVAQWITFAIVVLVAVTILIIVTDGGDFNPFDDEGNLVGAPATAAATLT
jgi:hypothetical protein